MAYREHFGVEISKNDFGGGMETVRFFERLGFEMDYRGSSKKSSSIKEEKKIAHSKEKLDEQKLKKEVIDVGKHTNQIKNKETNIEKIVIPTKRVIEQKNALQLILNRIFDGDIVCEKTYSWLKTPDQIKGIYKNLYDAISSYHGDTTFAKEMFLCGVILYVKVKNSLLNTMSVSTSQKREGFRWKHIKI